jgi:hypothetical protein
MTRKEKAFAYWAAHLDAIKREAVSKAEYAQRHGISVKRLYYWHRMEMSTLPTPEWLVALGRVAQGAR